MGSKNGRVRKLEARMPPVKRHSEEDKRKEVAERLKELAEEAERKRAEREAQGIPEPERTPEGRARRRELLEELYADIKKHTTQRSNGMTWGDA
jgi:hypothetical protein